MTKFNFYRFLPKIVRLRILKHDYDDVKDKLAYHKQMVLYFESKMEEIEWKLRKLGERN